MTQILGLAGERNQGLLEQGRMRGVFEEFFEDLGGVGGEGGDPGQLLHQKVVIAALHIQILLLYCYSQ